MHSLSVALPICLAVWAFKRRPPFATVGPQASLFPAGYDFTHQFFTPHEFGAAMRRCDILPAETAVVHRCRCPDAAVCGQLEELVARLAEAGKLIPAGPFTSPA